MGSTILRKSAALAFAVCSLGLASQASAAVINLAEGDSRYLGRIQDGNPPASFIDFTNTLLGVALGATQTIGTETYYRSSNTCNGAACAEVTDGAKTDLVQDPQSDPFTIPGFAGYEYVWGKYDADKAGAYVWYIGNLPSGTDGLTIPSFRGDCGQGPGCGLSNWALMNAGTQPPPPIPPTDIPEPASLALLGLGLAGLALTRRRRQQ